MNSLDVLRRWSGLKRAGETLNELSNCYPLEIFPASHAARFGHIFPHPTLDGKFWSMLCYTNGDLMRKKVRDDYAGGDWDKFSALLADTPPGNDGLFGYFTVTNEITPALAVGEPVSLLDAASASVALERRYHPCSKVQTSQRNFCFV